MDIRILGPLEVGAPGRVVTLARGKPQVVFTALVLRRGQVVSGDELAEAVWDGELPASWATTMQGYISHLRKALGAEVIQTRPAGYLLALDGHDVDAGRFEALVGEGRRALASGDAGGAVEALSEGLSLWRGPALAEFSSRPFARAEAARLEELRLVAIEELVEAELSLGRHHDLVGRLRSLVDANMLRERLWGQLMLALYRSGRSAEALRTYAEVRRLLGDELGIEPGPALRRLEQDMLLQRPELDWRRPAGPARAPVPSNLPAFRSSFVGREDELRQLDKALAVPGLVTMMGPGGVGKTRLAIEAARAVRSRFPDGVWLVELAPLSDSSLVPQAVARALGVRDTPGQPYTETVAATLAGGRCLIVLDNCEHVVAAAAGLTDSLLRAAPQLAILATSREPLRVEGEVVWSTPSLPVPSRDDLSPEALAGVDAVRLFCDRASAQGPFAFDSDNASSVSALCRRLDGIPLAIELAAARTAALSPAQILDRLDQRFRVLTAGRRSVPRHETLRAAVEWSHDLLSQEERILFRRLSVFRGFPLDAAEKVCCGGDLEGQKVAPVLADLVDRSLVVAMADGGGLRYSLLETLRAYAAERLAESGEEKDVRSRHLEWIVWLGENYDTRQWSHVPAPDAPEWEARSRIEHDNVREAHTWALSNDPSAALCLVRDLALQWARNGYLSEGRAWATAALAAGTNAAPELRAWALRRAGTLAGHQGDYAAGQPLHEEAAAIFRSLGAKEPLAGTLAGGMGPNMMSRDLRAGRAILEEALSIAREIEAHKWVAWASGCLASVAADEGDFERAEELMSDALTGFRHLGTGVDQWQGQAGWLALAQGHIARARGLFEEALAGHRRRNDKRLLSSSSAGLAEVALLEGDLETAHSLFAEALELGRDTAMPPAVSQALRGLARVAIKRGDAPAAKAALAEAINHNRELTRSERFGDARVAAAVAVADGKWEHAAELFAATERLREELGAPLPPVDRPQYEHQLTVLRSELSRQAFAAAWKRGRSMTPEEAVRKTVAGWTVPAVTSR